MPLLKRTTHKPQAVESITEPKQGFIQIDFADIDLAIDSRLTAAELRLWLYLGKLDRYGDKLVDLPTPKELAIRLGLSQRTVEKAAFRLDELGLFTFRVKAWQGANSSAARAKQTSEAMKRAKKDREAAKPLPDGSGYLAEDAANLPESGYLTESAVNLPEKRLNNPNQPPKPLPQADSKTPHTSSDFSDLDQTLSEGKPGFSQFWNGLSEEERERFEAYCKAVTANYQKPVVRIKDWLASTDKAGESRWESLYKEFKASEAVATPADDEASQAKQQELANRRKQAKEFLSEQNTDPDREAKCVPAPQKSAVQPQETVEEPEVSNQPEESVKESKIEGKGFGIDKELINRIKARNKKAPKPTEQELDQYVRTDVAPPHD